MKTLIISWHGLGDNIMLGPVLKKYEEIYNEEIYLAHLARLPVYDVFAECPYIRGFHTISDVWNDYPNVEVGREAVWNEARGIAREYGYDNVREVTMAPSLGIVHKMLRAAHELQVELDDYTLEIFPAITEDVKKQATAFMRGIKRPATFIAPMAGNPPKNVPSSFLRTILQEREIEPTSVIEYESHQFISNHLPLGNIPLEMEILRRCKHVICGDSFIMHAAAAMKKPTTAIFISTPPEWVIPLHDTPIEILAKI